MSVPNEFSRRVLLCVTGLTPQIVTETIFALLHQDDPWIPTEVRVLSTQVGAERARLMLLAPDRDQFSALTRDYDLDDLSLHDSDISMLRDAEGKPLEDIRTQADNLAAADGIARVIAELTSDSDTALHVSIAGGRKTLGFFAGYALSLYGRPQDRLSHVLVSQGFESNPEFFFPPRQPRVLLRNNGEPISTADARVILADIPFVRLRSRLPEHHLRGLGSFAEAVEAAQRLQDPPHLLVDLKQRTIVCGAEPVTLSHMNFAIYAWLAVRCEQDSDASVPLHHFTAVDSSLREALRDFGTQLLKNEMDVGAEKWLAHPWNDDRQDHAQWLSEQRTRINKRLRSALGDEGQARYGIKTRLIEGAGKSSVHMLDLPPNSIEILR